MMIYPESRAAICHSVACQWLVASFRTARVRPWLCRGPAATRTDSDRRLKRTPAGPARSRRKARRLLHLEPCRPSISKFGPSISLYYDIEGETFDIEGRKMTFDIGYDMTTRYQRFWHSTSNASNLINVDIEGCNIRYRTSTTSVNSGVLISEKISTN